MTHQDRLMLSAMYRLIITMLMLLLMTVMSKIPKNLADIYKTFPDSIKENEDAIDKWLTESKEVEHRWLL